jgi:hypothetical protein
MQGIVNTQKDIHIHNKLSGTLHNSTNLDAPLVEKEYCGRSMPPLREKIGR